MATIAIIDDKEDQSTTVKTNFELVLDELGSDIKVITSFPLMEPESYFEFITNNEVSALVLDEKLNDDMFNGQGPVDYKGNEVVSLIRSKIKEIPIFTITTFDHDQELLEKFSEYDQVINRGEFYDNPEKFVPIVVRSIQRFLNQNIDELSEFNELTKNAASGNIDEEGNKRLEALQIKLHLPLMDFNDRDSWLKEYDKQIENLEALKKEIEEKFMK
jgi:hypothetical protein